MKFNKFLWNSFISSEEGRNSVSFFSGLFSAYETNQESLIQFLDKWNSQGQLDYKSWAEDQIHDVMITIQQVKTCIDQGFIPKEVDSFEEAKKLYYDLSNLFYLDVNGEEKIVYRKLNLMEVEDESSQEDYESLDGEIDVFSLDDIQDLSIALSCLYPKFFFPYHFYPNFYALKQIFSGFGIYLPPVPKKSETGERFFYYLELCESMHKFWSELELDTIHIPSFLYDFAPNVVEINFPEINKLPKPKRAWFVGGGINNNGDFNYLDQINSDSRPFWQGNKDTDEGDIIIMYCLSPRSQIHSIWRALRNGDVEPFFHFYSTVWMGFPQKTKPITINEIKNDPVLKEFPLVKGNMQGINGRLVPKRYYDRILDILKQKGMDTSSLPLLEDMPQDEYEIKNERDVELQILEPLLKNLDYREEDWERQVSLRVGRTEKVIPDYLIFPKKGHSDKSVKASWVWEAKFSIKNNNQLRTDFEQAVSYARLVCAKGVSLISLEGIWIGQSKDDFKFEKSIYISRQQLSTSDGLNELRRFVSRKIFREREQP